MKDLINPTHYQSGDFECIDFAEQMPFCLGNAFKYAWRAGKKTSADLTTDLQKCRWYIKRAQAAQNSPHFAALNTVAYKLPQYIHQAKLEKWRDELLSAIAYCDYDKACAVIGGVLDDNLEDKQ